MRFRWQKLWPLLKLVLTAAILVAIGRQFAHDLENEDLWKRSFHPG